MTAARDKDRQLQEPGQVDRRSPTTRATNARPRASARRPTKTSPKRQARPTDSESREKDSRGVRFKFVCIRTQQSSVSTVGDGESLFSRGKRFFRESNPDAEVNKLICYVPSRSELRNLYNDECEDANDFIHEIRGYQESTGNTEPIEVRYQLG